MKAVKCGRRSEVARKREVVEESIWKDLSFLKRPMNSQIILGKTGPTRNAMDRKCHKDGAPSYQRFTKRDFSQLRSSHGLDKGYLANKEVCNSNSAPVSYEQRSQGL